MHLNEIIENNTIEQISKRTRLTHENLEKLFANDFKDFTKVQALGFISILEREYRADLSSLRDKCMAFFSDGATPAQAKKEPTSRMQSADESPIVAPMNLPKRTPRYVKPMIIGLVAIGLLYAAWQTFASNMQTPGKVSDQRQDAGFFSSIFGQSDNTAAAEENKTDIDAKLPQEDQKAWAKKEETRKNSFVITNNAKKSKMKVSKSSEDKKVDEENEIIKNVKAQQAQVQQVKKSDRLSVEEIQSINNAIANANDTEKQNTLSPEVPSISKGTTSKQTQVIKNKASQAEMISQKRAAEDIEKQKAEAKKAAQKRAAQQKAAEEKARKLKIAQQKAAKEKADKAKAAKEAARKKALAAKAAKAKAAKLKAAKAKAEKEKLAKAKAAKLKAEKEKAAKAKDIKNAKYVIMPSKSIWLGIVDLRTMKRRTYTGTGVSVFNNPNGRWIVATNHGHFSFRAGTRVVKFNNNRKHYLIIQKGNIHEIPHETFQKLNKSKAW